MSHRNPVLRDSFIVTNLLQNVFQLNAANVLSGKFMHKISDFRFGMV